MKFNIALIPGDGVGPEVVSQATKVLDAVAEAYDHIFLYKEAKLGSCAIETTRNPLPEETLAICNNADAILFGAVGDPKYDNDPTAKVRPEQGLLNLRKALGLYCNIRPVKAYDNLLSNSPLKREVIKNADFVIYRELTGGIYFGEKSLSQDGQTAFDSSSYSVQEIARVTHLAFQAAQKRKKKVTLVDKANVLETSRLWRETVQAMEKDYPEVEVSYEFVDAVAMRLVQWPNSYDVLITENLFGDILTDEASVISGSMGLMPSASLGADIGLFEPIHGSYPQAAGKNIANPMATVLSAAMMFENFGLQEEGKAIRDAVNKALTEGIVTEDLADGGKAYGTSEVGDWLAESIS